MKIKTTVFLFFFLSTIVEAQPSLKVYIKYYELKETEKSFRKEEKRGFVVPGSIFFEQDTLKATLRGKENIYLKATFKLEEGYCNYEEVLFDCQCAYESLNDLLQQKWYGWKKISNSKYISKYSFQTELEIFGELKKGECLSIKLKYIDKSKAEYKIWYDAL